MPARSMTIQDLKKELAQRMKALDKIQSERKKLLVRLAALDEEIAAVAGGGTTQRRAKRTAKKAVKTRGPGRPKGVRTAKKAKKAKKAKVAKVVRRRRRATGKPLTEYLQDALAGAKKGMRTTELVAAVTKAGYVSHSKNFYAVVAMGLRDMKVFRRLGRGIYGLAR